MVAAVGVLLLGADDGAFWEDEAATLEVGAEDTAGLEELTRGTEETTDEADSAIELCSVSVLSDTELSGSDTVSFDAEESVENDELKVFSVLLHPQSTAKHRVNTTNIIPVFFNLITAFLKFLFKLL